MQIEGVKINGFRNIASADVTLNHDLNVFYGNNGQGKTNFLEAVYLCASGRSWRTKSDKDLVGFNEKEAFLYTKVSCNGIYDDISINIKKDEKKIISVNRQQVKKLGDLLGTLLIVVFSPDDLVLVKSGPSERRKFMDVELCQLYKLYYYELKQYYHVLRQRNNLLKSLKKDDELKNTIDIWDEVITRHGIKIMGYRADFISRVNDTAEKIHYEISDNKEKLKIIYKPNVSEKEYRAKLVKTLDRDIQLGTTTVGVHKDEIVYLINNQDARAYASQGQQRLACLSSKLAEVEIIKEEKKEDPILLLDDVFSEFDSTRQKFLLKYIKNIQTLITVTNAEKFKDRGFLFKVDGGVILCE